ncbi:DUF1211 domain-containing protein [Patescibacteria group bacterium]|nr:DUF1211 domain-containing protein [Patescibacteria group bacterium]
MEDTKHKEKFTIRHFFQKKEAWIKTSSSLSRIIAYSDAVFAIAVTILILQIDVPDKIGAAELPSQLIETWPNALSYIISFAVISRFWFSHLHLFSYLKTVDRKFAILNLLFLFTITFLPFPTDLYGTHSSSRFALVLYALSITLVALINFFLWFYVYKHPKMLQDHVDKRIIAYVGRQVFVVPIVFLISIGFIYISPVLVPFFWLFYIVASLTLSILSRRYEKRRIAKGTETL